MDDYIIRVWNASAGEEMGWNGDVDRDNTVTSVDISPDGKLVASASSGDNIIRIWDAFIEGVVGKLLEGHTSLINFVAFSPDGKYVVSASNDFTIRIWDAQIDDPIKSPVFRHMPLGTTSRHYSFVESERLLPPSGPHFLKRFLFSPEPLHALTQRHHVEFNDLWEDHKKIYDDDEDEVGMTWYTEDEWVKHGWVKYTEDQLLFWVPLELRKHFWWPNTVAVMGSSAVTADLSNFVFGTSWVNCKDDTVLPNIRQED